ncbi:MAG: hypothetical protein ACYCZ2_09695 [Lutibacter sp.]
MSIKDAQQPMVSKRKKIREWLAHYITEKVELCIVKESVMAKKQITH